MDPALVNAHLEGERRLRQILRNHIGQVWNGLPGHDRANLDQWLSETLPAVLAAEQQSSALTNAYVAAALERGEPFPVDPEQVTGPAIRGGVDPSVVYERPFITLWSLLGEGQPWGEASATALQRAETLGATDVQLAMRDTLGAIQAAEPAIVGWERVSNPGACAFCQQVNGAFVYGGSEPMPLHANCVVGTTRISAPSSPASFGAEPADFGGAHAVTRRWYEGEVVVLRTASGNELTITPNHPILTPSGWIEAHRLREGNSVISRTLHQRERQGVPDEQDVPASIEERFRALLVNGLISVPLAAEHFHGDGVDGNVDVVLADRNLRTSVLAALGEPRKHLPLSLGLRQRQRLTGLRRFGKSLVRTPAAAPRRMCGLHAAAALVAGFGGGTESVLLGRSPGFHTGFTQVANYHRSRHAQAPRDRQNRLAPLVGVDGVRGKTEPPLATDQVSRFQRPVEGRLADADNGRSLRRALAGEVQPDRIVHLRRVGFSGHVFNVLTVDGWYSADGILTHNCGCSAVPVLIEKSGSSRTATPLPEGLAVHEHGELGPVLTAAGDHFMGESEALAR